MYFRCIECLAATWIDRPTALTAGETVSCGACARVHVARPPASLAPTLAAHYRATLARANSESLDMPSAYSAVLGLAETGAARDAPRSAPVPVLLDYDPAFQPAIDAGRLTVEQAIKRGAREAWVAGLVRRHALPHGLACGVADNRFALHEALKRRPEPRPPTPPPRRRRRSVRVPEALFALGLCGAAVGLVALLAWQRAFAVPPALANRPVIAQPSRVQLARRDNGHAAPASAATPAAARIAATRVRRDDGGQIVEIVAPDPAAVLEAYCSSAAESGLLVPLEITETVPRLGNARHGVFRDPRAAGDPRAIWMREDRLTRRWVAGDGSNEIPVGTPPVLDAGAFRKSVGGAPAGPAPTAVAATLPS